MEIKEIQEEIIDEFSMFDDWMQRYEYMIELGKSLPLIKEEFKTDDNIIKGCQSKVWLHAEMQDDKLHFEADSDAFIARGIIGLLIRILSDQDPETIAKADLFAIDQIGLKEHLSPNRANGLSNMIKKLKMYAVAHAAKA